jgi:hypothetical protein
MAGWAYSDRVTNGFPAQAGLRRGGLLETHEVRERPASVAGVLASSIVFMRPCEKNSELCFPVPKSPL